jgi:hypothetical protein
MTTRQVLITRGSQHLPCGRLAAFHSDGMLFTILVHGSSTQLQPCPPARMYFVHNIHRPYDYDETYQDGSRPEYLGTKGSRSRPVKPDYLGTTETPRQMLANGPESTRVDPHLCKTHCCVAVSTHAG